MLKESSSIVMLGNGSIGSREWYFFFFYDDCLHFEPRMLKSSLVCMCVLMLTTDPLRL